MRRRLAVAAARAARAVRGLWPDRNPLRRPVDRAEAVIVGWLAVAFLAGAPLAAATAGHIAYAVAARTAHAQQADWHRVPAVLLTAVPLTAAASPGYGYQPVMRARWTAPDGQRRTGMVPAPPAARAGSTVMIWIDAVGRLTGPPLQPSQVEGQAVLAVVAAPVVVGLIVLCAGQLAHYLLGRRRLAAWDAEWRGIGPQWTRQR